MPEVKNLDQPLVFVQPVIDSDRGVENFADPGSSPYRDAKPRKVLENLDMVEKSRAKPFRGSGVVRAYVVENDL